MACGRPIITTDAPGCRETVKDGVNGYLVELKNVQALIEIIMKVIDNREGLEKKGNESRKIAVEKYDVNIVNKQIEMVIGLNK
jgi:glycosyltransferase involved in cell wall biosynthesis